MQTLLSGWHHKGFPVFVNVIECESWPVNMESTTSNIACFKSIEISKIKNGKYDLRRN